jgi:hypothetical protein
LSCVNSSYVVTQRGDGLIRMSSCDADLLESDSESFLAPKAI